MLRAQLAGKQRVFALVLGQARTRLAAGGDRDLITADQVGAVAVAASAGDIGGQQIRLRDQAEFARAIALLRGPAR